MESMNCTRARLDLTRGCSAGASDKGELRGSRAQDGGADRERSRRLVNIRRNRSRNKL